MTSPGPLRELHAGDQVVLSRNQVFARQRQAEDLLADREVPASSAAVFRLVEVRDGSACGCEFIAAAETLGTQLVTGDRQLLWAFPELTIPLQQGASTGQKSLATAGSIRWAVLSSNVRRIAAASGGPRSGRQGPALPASAARR